ncbi:MAG: tRNA pseudouridine(13) synthase TruD [Planctomycetota bacterium]|nr:tRNA pseudouridine(13) synthase TruD [Planctomycetota bacterium]MDA1159722.1 tRNA pseudouridine(13) synthase TruD [Planctomycetota bacterium]
MTDSDPVADEESFASSNALPFLTNAPGIGGLLKQSPDDFFVDEIPVYEASGEGDFLFLHIEKRGIPTPDLLRHIEHTLSLKQADVGCAGRKDAQAVTRQYVSVPAAASDLIEKLDSDQIKVLSDRRHTNKLKTGHLRGNRFRIVVRDAATNADQLAAELVSRLRQSGFPNYFGEQRFGNAGTTDDLGFRMLRGERVRRLSRDGLRFTLSAVQSRMFNAWVADRISDGLSGQVLKGDVMQVTTSKGPFVVTDAAIEQARYDSHETVLSGPIFGPKMKQPEVIPAEREQAILDRFDLPREAFSKFKKLTQGTRRPMVIWPDDLAVQNVDNGIEFSFTLPSGVYATCLMRELMKTA